MSELVIPPGFCNAHYLFSETGDPQVMSCARAWKVDTPGSANLLAEQLAEGFATDGDGWGTNNMFDQWTFVGVRVTVGNDGPPIIGEFLPNIVGTASSTNTPPQNCSVLFKKTTGFGGRKFRGRLYLPPINLSEASVNNVGMLTSGYISDAQAAMDRWTTNTGALVDGFDGECLLHSGSEDPTQPVDVFIESQIGTQRRRLR